MYTPKEITKDKDNGTEVASFDYYSGINYAKQHNLQQTTLYTEVCRRTHFMVCCGDVMIVVDSSFHPEIQRREI